MFYSYDFNKIYTATISGQKNPRGSGRLKPARSTEVAPPTLVEGQAAQFDEDTNEWSIVPDTKHVNTKLSELNADGVPMNEVDGSGFVKTRSAEDVLVDKKTLEVKALYDAMVKDVYDEMLIVFGTSNDVSAQASALTFEAMAKRPGNYVGNLGLVDEAAVLTYANSKIAAADAYAVFRMNRIAKFQTDRAAV